LVEWIHTFRSLIEYCFLPRKDQMIINPVCMPKAA
jgi:hypothetical protein